MIKIIKVIHLCSQRKLRKRSAGEIKIHITTSTAGRMTAKKKYIPASIRISSILVPPFIILN